MKTTIFCAGALALALVTNAWADGQNNGQLLQQSTSYTHTQGTLTDETRTYRDGSRQSCHTYRPDSGIGVTTYCQ